MRLHSASSLRSDQDKSGQEVKMAKVVRCRDIGFDCEGVVRAETEEEVLAQVAAHAKAVHNIETVPPEVVEKVRQVMRDE
jgi:predicted small metal-binding protein